MDDSGDYAHKVGDIIIHFDFWSSCGDVVFVVENASSQDISLDMSKSFFIKNGLAYDYFQNRTEVVTTGSTVTKGSAISTSQSVSASGTRSVAGAASVSADGVSLAAAAGAALTYGVTKGVAGAATSSTSTMRSHSVEYKEKDIVVIPAHSSKVFGEYTVASGEYKKCSLDRIPHKGSSLNFDMFSSPYVFENRLVFVVDGQEIPVNSSFFVSEFQNLPKKKVIHSEQAFDCNGRIMGEVKYNIFESADKYYVHYL